MKKLTLVLSMLIALVGFNANAEMYIVGSGAFGGWAYDAGNLMTDNGDGTYTYVTTIQGSVWFIFADGQGEDWDDFNGNYRYGPVSGGNEVVNANTEYTTQKSNDGNASYQFTGSGNEYTFIFDSNNMTFKVEGIVDVIDESDKEHMARLVIELKKGANAELILNYLLKNTELQVNYNFNMVANYEPTEDEVIYNKLLDNYKILKLEINS